MKNLSAITLTITIIVSVALVAFASFLLLKDITWYGVERTRSDSCSKSLRNLRTYFAIYSVEITNNLYPPNLNTLFDELQGLFPEEHNIILSCSCARGSTADYYNIFGQHIRTEYPKYSDDFRYFYNNNLPESDKTILMYCPNYKLHRSKVPTLFFSGEVEYISFDRFRKLFDEQGSLLTKEGIEFSFEEGIK